MILKPFMLRRIKCDVENELSEKVSVVRGEELVLTVIAFQNPIYPGENLPLGNAFLLNSNIISS